MLRSLLKSKIHRVVVTEANLDYEGSLTIDGDLMQAAEILPFEQIHIWDVTNGSRITTYAIEGERGSGIICVNGAGAHLVQKGHIIIIATFGQYQPQELHDYHPVIILVNENNRIKEKRTH